jgi:hypothetical protein
LYLRQRVLQRFRLIHHVTEVFHALFLYLIAWPSAHLMMT